MMPAALLPLALSAFPRPAVIVDRDWFLIGFTPALFGLAVAGADLAWRGELITAFQTTAAYGMGVGFLPAVAELLLGPGSLLRSVGFFVPVFPAVPATWFLAAAWLKRTTPATPKAREESHRTATHIAAVFGALATMETVILLVLVRAAEAPCDAYNASQTACSTAVELPTFGMCAFVIIFPAMLLVTLGALLKTEALAILGTTWPGFSPR